MTGLRCKVSVIVFRAALQLNMCFSVSPTEIRGVVKGTFGTFGTAKSLALDEILG